MSNRVGMRELRQQTSGVLRRVVAGETIDLTDHGHPVARLVPLSPGVLDQMIAEGRATAAEQDLLALLDELRLPAAPRRGRLSPTSALDALRADER